VIRSALETSFYKMDQVLQTILAPLEEREPATPDEIASVARAAPFALPSDYLNFLRWSNGIEGDIGKTYWLALWPTADVVEVNAEYARLGEDAPFVIGGDGGGILIGIDVRESQPTLPNYALFDAIDLRASSALRRERSLLDIVKHMRDA
jgi:hypothetical protein